MHSYYTAQAQTHTCAEMELPLLKASWISRVWQTKSPGTVSVFILPVCTNSVGFTSRHEGKVIEAWNKYGPKHAML